MSVQCQVCSNPYSLEAIIQDASLSGLKVTTSVPLSRLTAEETRGPGSRYDCESRGVTESLWRNLYFLSSLAACIFCFITLTMTMMTLIIRLTFNHFVCLSVSLVSLHIRTVHVTPPGDCPLLTDLLTHRYLPPQCPLCTWASARLRWERLVASKSGAQQTCCVIQRGDIMVSKHK